jgi:hypothetical protein
VARRTQTIKGYLIPTSDRTTTDLTEFDAVVVALGLSKTDVVAQAASQELRRWVRRWYRRRYVPEQLLDAMHLHVPWADI